MNDYDGRFLDGKKLVKKLLQKIERFDWDKNENRLVLDKTGRVCFVNDVIDIIEKAMEKKDSK